MLAMYRLLLPGLSLVAAVSCAGSPARGVVDGTATTPVSLTPACVTLADSVQAQTPVTALTLVTPLGRPAMPRLPRDAQPGVPVHAVFRVRPDGRADMSTLAISGTFDVSFQGALRRALEGVRFHVALLRGCPVPGRGDFQIVGFSVVRPPA